MTRAEFLLAVRSRVARIAVGPSTVRGRGNSGATTAARAFLRNLDLTEFGGRGEKPFVGTLDAATDSLRKSLPRGARHWGLARKILNIFLRDCLYTTYLDAEYGLHRNEGHFELPLDSLTALSLRRAAGRGQLPPWPGVKHLTPELSGEFQDAAQLQANKLGVARIHLDAVWWSLNRDSAGT